MAVLPICRYPDPVLRKKAALVHKMGAELDAVVKDMVDTMYGSPATIGLAAPQIGRSLRLIVLDVTPKEKRHGLVVLLNPVLVHGSDPKIIREGCLSLPDYTGNVKRFQHVIVEGKNPQGETIRIETTGIEAICFQHEIDHVEGVLFIDRVESLKTDIFRRKRYKSI